MSHGGRRLSGLAEGEAEIATACRRTSLHSDLLLCAAAGNTGAPSRLSMAEICVGADASFQADRGGLSVSTGWDKEATKTLTSIPLMRGNGREATERTPPINCTDTLRSNLWYRHGTDKSDPTPLGGSSTHCSSVLRPQSPAHNERGNPAYAVLQGALVQPRGPAWLAQPPCTRSASDGASQTVLR
jgi:hypothetical protein